MKTSIEFNVKPDWNEIEKIRDKSAGFLQAHNLADDTIHSLSMVISELVENGIKYGSFSTKENRVIAVISMERNAVSIEVINPVGENSVKHLSRLDKTIQWIRGYQDPFEPYIERLKEVSKQPLNDAGSGLGLVRIAYEGKALLDFFVNEKRSLNVSAVSKIAGDEKSHRALKHHLAPEKID